MRRSSARVLLTLALAARHAGAAEGHGWVARAVNQTLTAACDAELAPDVAAIQGGISASSLKPGEAAAQIERQLGEIKRLAASHGGALNLLERVRAVRPTSLGPVPDGRGTQPFLMVQRLEVTAPATAPIDAALDGLLGLGLDQFGPDLRLDPDRQSHDSAPQILVRYRISKLREKLETIQSRCRLAAFDGWCAAQAEDAERAACAAALRSVERRFVTQSFVLQSQPVLRGPGPPTPVVLPQGPIWQPDVGLRHELQPLTPPAAAELELLGNVTLRLTGSISLSLPGAR